MKILVFGAGAFYQRYRYWLNKYDILAVIDNDKSKQGKSLDGHPIVSVDEGLRLPFDGIYILGEFVDSMAEDLKRRGVAEDAILRESNLKEFVRRHMEDASVEIKKPKKIYVFSHDFSLSGGPVAAFSASYIMRNLGYEVCIASPIDGPISDKALKAGISVIVDSRLNFCTLNDIEYVKDADVVWVNTTLMAHLLVNRNVDIPTIAWLHEPPSMYKYHDVSFFEKVNPEKLSIFAVSSVAENAFKKKIKGFEVSRLLFGVTDLYSEHKKTNPHSKFIFAVVGNVSTTKGQDIFVDAIDLLSDEVKENSKFLIIGKATSRLASDLIARTQHTTNIKFTGTLDRDTVLDLYSRIDTLVVPSREDSMPTVAAEAMMNEVPCIVSTGTGTAQIISSGENGLVFRNGDTKELAEKMTWMYRHESERMKMGITGRRLFKKYFDMDVFERNLKEIMENVLRK